MINAAIVGLGWWGKTLVESVQGHSDDVRFVAGATRTRSPEAEAFAGRSGVPPGRRVRGAAGRSGGRRGRPRDTPLGPCAPGHRGRRGGQARLLREAVRARQGRCRGGRRRGSRGRRDARPRLQPALPSRDDEAARADPLGRARRRHARRGDDDVSERALPHAEPVARKPGGDAVRGAHSDGRPRRRRHDRPLRRHRPRLLPELPASRRDRRRRHHLDPVSDEGRHVRLPRHDHRDRARASAFRCSAPTGGYGSRG